MYILYMCTKYIIYLYLCLCPSLALSLSLSFSSVSIYLLSKPNLKSSSLLFLTGPIYLATHLPIHLNHLHVSTASNISWFRYQLSFLFVIIPFDFQAVPHVVPPPPKCGRVVPPPARGVKCLVPEWCPKQTPQQT